MPSAAECIARLTEAAPELGDDDLVGVIETLDGLQQQRRAEGSLEAAERAMFDDAERLAEDARIGALIERRNAADNVLKRRRLIDKIDRFSNDAEGVEAVNVGSNERVEGARESVDAMAQGLEARLLGGLVADLRREGVLELVTRRANALGDGAGTIDREIAIEMWEKTRPQGKPGSTGNAQAKTIAGIFVKYEDLAVVLQNRSGAHIRKMPGYIVRQSHDQVRLQRAGYAAWRDAILPRLDRARTFQGQDQEAFLRAAYDNLASGDHLKADGSAPMLGFKGPGNLAKRISQHRVLHFNSAAEWFDYNQAFGSASVVEAVVGGLSHAARNTALMQVWGTNPRAMFESVTGQLRRRNKDNLKISNRLRGNQIDAQFKVVDGTTRAPRNLTGARIGHNIRAIETMAKLGGATVSSITDIPLIASELRHQGGGFLDGYGLALENLTRGRGRGETREMMDLVGVGIDGIVGDIAARFSATDQLPGTMSKLVQRFFKLNLLTWWTDSHKTGVGMVMSRRLAQLKGQGWDGLNPRRQRSLSNAGFDAAQWDLLRRHAVRPVPGGGEFLMPDMIQDIPDRALSGLVDGKPSPRKLALLRDQLQTRLQAYYADRVDVAVLTPGAREQAIMTRGFQPGTVEGEVIRFIGMFKSFPTSIITKVWGREVEQSGFWRTIGATMRGKAGSMQVAALIVQMTALGYVAQSAKEILKGRRPRDPRSLATWGAAFAQGGGAGLYGDFLVGEYNRFGGGVAASLLGPVAGSVEDLGNIWASAIRGEDPSATAFQMVKNNTPFLNLFYTRAALDYLILYQMQEAMNPGYLARMERRIERENNQTFFAPPSQIVGR